MKHFVILRPSLRPVDPHTCTDAEVVRNWRYSPSATVREAAEEISGALGHRGKSSS